MNAYLIILCTYVSFTEPVLPVTGKERRDIIHRRMEWRRVLPELRVPLNGSDDSDDVRFLDNGKPIPFEHPQLQSEEDTPRSDDSTVKKTPQIPNLWPFK